MIFALIAVVLEWQMHVDDCWILNLYNIVQLFQS